MAEGPEESFAPNRVPDGARPRWLELELADGYRTAVCLLAPGGRGGPPPGGLPAPARLPVLYLHGIQSHPGWFVGSAAHLAARGHPVYLVTRRGSGRNGLARGHAASARQLLDDVDAACRFVLAQTGAARLHLLGVSWGGKLLAAYASRRRGFQGRRGFQPRSESGEMPLLLVASLTLVAPGIVSRVDLAWWAKAAVGACALLCPRRQFDIPLGAPALFTDNEPMRQYIRRDGLSLRRATARFLLASRMLDRMIRRAPAGAIRPPTALILAGRDRIIDIAATRQEVLRLTAGRCQVRELPGAHTLEFEPDPSALYEALAEALSAGEKEE